MKIKHVFLAPGGTGTGSVKMDFEGQEIEVPLLPEDVARLGDAVKEMAVKQLSRFADALADKGAA